MLKKSIKLFVIFITLFYFYMDLIYAYEYHNKDNKDNVNSMIREIYDAKEQYEDLVGVYEKSEIVLKTFTSTSYWWPIGSETTTKLDGRTYAADEPVSSIITSNFGYRKNPLGEGTQFHSGVDISGNYDVGVVNIIAVKSGTVVYPTNNAKVDCPYSTSASNCGGGYGNYVVIQHSDGNYTLYAHLHENTITVKAGDSVDQGQVIGKMGSSGNSTGPHLHFEVREGQNTFDSTVDPLNYISLETTRKVASDSGEFLEWLKSWEGGGKKDGSDYIVQDLGDGVRTVGSGITLEYNKKRFEKYGIDIADYPAGSKIPIEIVDQIKLERIADDKSYVEKELAKASITLEQNQIEALVARKYNYNIVGFTTAYKKYGNTQELYDNYMSTPITSQGKVLRGLVRRREAEWKLFHEGIYDNN